MLSFPMPGISLALDLPYRAGDTQALVDALNERVIAAGGRIYLTKDALTRPEHFARDGAAPRALERGAPQVGSGAADLRSAHRAAPAGPRAVKAALFGATRGMGRAVARVLAARGERLFLLGRDPEALARSARDLEVRGAHAPVGSAHCDLLDPSGFDARLDAADRALDGFDTAIVTAGLFATQDAPRNRRAHAPRPARRRLRT